MEQSFADAVREITTTMRLRIVVTNQRQTVSRGGQRVDLFTSTEHRMHEALAERAHGLLGAAPQSKCPDALPSFVMNVPVWPSELIVTVPSPP